MYYWWYFEELWGFYPWFGWRQSMSPNTIIMIKMNIETKKLRTIMANVPQRNNINSHLSKSSRWGQMFAISTFVSYICVHLNMDTTSLSYGKQEKSLQYFLKKVSISLLPKNGSRLLLRSAWERWKASRKRGSSEAPVNVQINTSLSPFTLFIRK